MVAFETHAGQMIDALWKSISDLCHLDRDSLSYFRTHVGGADPAEPYHIKMTAESIASPLFFALQLNLSHVRLTHFFSPFPWLFSAE